MKFLNVSVYFLSFVMIYFDYTNKGFLMKKILMILLFFVAIVNAKVLNSVALVVEKEPITNYDIEQTMKLLKLPREQALAVLINEKINCKSNNFP